MPWPRDDAKLERVRALMAEQELDALVVRAPDNVLYLTNFWGMKGYDAVVFPREGEPVADLPRGLAGRRGADEPGRRRSASSTATTRAIRGRPGCARSTSRGRSRPGTTASASSSRSARRRRTGWSASRRRTRRRGSTRFRTALDATPLLAQARAIKTEQEIERMRLANEIAAGAMEHVQARIRPGMRESEVGAMWNGWVHDHGTGFEGQGRARARLLARLVGAGDPHLHRDRQPADRRARADAVRDLGLRRRLLVRPHQEPRPRRARRRATPSSSSS